MQKAQSNFKIGNLNWKADALDWIGDTVEEIGYHTGYEPKKLPLKIKDFRAKVPAQIISLEGVYVNGTRLAVVKDRQSQNLIDLIPSNYGLASDHHVMDLNKEWKRLEELREMYTITPTTSILDSIVDAQNKINLLVSNLVYYGRSAYMRCGWYRIDSGYIHTSFPAGDITIDANCFMVDDKGYPLVVDTAKYRNAIIWSIMYHLLLQGYEHPVIDLRYAEDKKDLYIAQAQNEPHIMSVDRQENFAARWNSLKRDADLVEI